MHLALETRDVGKVTIVRCKGRIVAGGETESLRNHIDWLLRDRRAIVLHLGEVGFIDSSGIGTMVRTLTSTRRVRGDLKLCNVPEHVGAVLRLSHLTDLFDSHDSEDSAVAAFYGAPAAPEKTIPAGKSVLCIDRNVDVVVYIRELLRRAGYDVHTSNNLRDALTLMQVTRFHLLLVGAEIAAAPATDKAFRAACAGIPVLTLEKEFSIQEAGEATIGLLEKITACLQSGPAA
jgi:anti-sigma B factor antagonist